MSISLHNPRHLGTFTIGTSQVNKQIVFAFNQAVNGAARISIIDRDKVLRTYTIGNGITLSNGNQTATLAIQGSQFSSVGGRTVRANCTFFTVGDLEVTFDIKVIRTIL